MIDLVERKTQQLSDLYYEVISVSYSIYKLRENHYVSEIGSDLVFLFRIAILRSDLWLIQKEIGDVRDIVRKLTLPAFYSHYERFITRLTMEVI